MHSQFDLLSTIGLCITAAALLAFISHKLRQPLILAHLHAGVVIGPQISFHWVENHEHVQIVAEIGLLLLLFIIGLEMDLKKLLAAGTPVMLTGILQFPLCVALGLGFFTLLGYRTGGGDFSSLYLAICLSLSSTMIVVKLLYDKFELVTLPGRITLGVLVFLDIWAFLALALQPNLLNPHAAPLLLSLFKGVLLVILCLGVVKYLLPSIFYSVAKVPELVPVSSLAWCFAVCAAANHAGWSREMGALVAGVCISTFPYNVDVIAKVVSIRDFFVTLFFVALGMPIPLPSLSQVASAAAASLFLVLTRLLKKMGIADLDEQSRSKEEVLTHSDKDIVLLGFFREASSLLHEFERQETPEGRHPLLDRLLVIDFNPQVHAELNHRGIACLYRDIANMDMLHHAHIQHADMVISTIPDSILKETSNLRLLKQVRRLCPEARIVVTVGTIPEALELYTEGADFVFLPRLYSVKEMAHVFEEAPRGTLDAQRDEQIEKLSARREVLD